MAAPQLRPIILFLITGVRCYYCTELERTSSRKDKYFVTIQVVPPQIAKTTEL
jgi:hypothetical protein